MTLRPSGWKAAHAVGLVQPVGRAAQLAGVDITVVSILADVRRTYIELHCRGPLQGTASLADPLGTPIARRVELDAGTQKGEYFIAFAGLPTAATQAVLTLIPRRGEPVILPLKIDPRMRMRGMFDTLIGSTLTILRRRFEVVRYSGGVTEGIVQYRLPPAEWPIEVHAAIGPHMGSQLTPLLGTEGELVVEAPTASNQVLELTSLRGLPIVEPLPLVPEIRVEGPRVVVRTPHIRVKSVEITHFTHPLAGGVEPLKIELKQWPAGTEMQALFPVEVRPEELTWRGFALNLDPAPRIRLARA